MKWVPLAFSTLLLYCTFTPTPTLGQTRLSGPLAGVLALRNGEVISGNILRDGDRYLITFGESAELRIAVSDVEFFGRDLQQLYRFKHAALVPTDTAGQWRLIDWSIRHGLLSQASQLLEDASADQRRLPKWTDLQRRLQLAKRPPISLPKASSTAARSTSKPELEQLLEEISSQNLQEFTSFIQPLLLNRCGTTTCHGALSRTEFKLVAPPRGRVIPTRYTQRNLFNTWKTVLPQQPDQSPLINIPTAPHGGAPTLFTQREWNQYQRLVNWVRRVGSKSPAIPPAEIRQPNPVLAQPGTLAPDGKATTQQPSLDPAAQRTRAVEAVLTSPRLPRTETKKTPPQAPPKSLPNLQDPFDPGIFNRKYHAERFRKTASATEDADTAKPKKETPKDARPATGKPVSASRGK